MSSMKEMGQMLPKEIRKLHEERHEILQLPDGVHSDLTDAVYHQRTLGVVSKTALDLISRSPAHYKAWIDSEAEEEEQQSHEHLVEV